MLIVAYETLKTVLNYFPLLLMPGTLVFFALALQKVNNRRAALLFSLGLPGALFWCVMLPVMAAVHMSPMIVNSLLWVIVFFPSAALLPVMTIIQFARLGRVNQNIGIVGWCAVAAIIALYFWTALVNRA